MVIPLDGIPFHPYYSVKDIVGVVVFLFVFSIVVFFMPEGGGYFLEYNNFIPADPLVTPPHIAPVWYFTPYYSLLRAVTYPLFGIDAKFWGVVAMGAGTLILGAFLGLIAAPVKSIRYRGPITKWLLASGSSVSSSLASSGPRIRPTSSSASFPAPRSRNCSGVLLPVFPDDADLVFPGSLQAGTGPGDDEMKKFLTAILFAPFLAFAAGATLHLDSAPDKSKDMAALQNGAKIFVNYCLNCHSASYMRYNRLQDIGLTDAQIKDNLLFTAEKVWRADEDRHAACGCQGLVRRGPPDLTIIARARASEHGSGADWLYTYLRTFYRDENRPTGWNNVVFENVGMPHVFWELQGEQVMGADHKFDAGQAG
jgi:hypothetical protein